MREYTIMLERNWHIESSRGALRAIVSRNSEDVVLYITGFYSIVFSLFVRYVVSCRHDTFYGMEGASL
jgi:hypothetical protein